jgi:hypothetical protein
MGNSATNSLSAIESRNEFKQAYSEFDGHHFRLHVARVADDRSIDWRKDADVHALDSLGFGTLDDEEYAFLLTGSKIDLPAIHRFKELARKAGALVLSTGLLKDLKCADSAAELWGLTIYKMLRGTSWDHTVERASIFDPFAASIETWNRLLPERSDVSNPRASTAPGDAAAKIVGFLLAHHGYHQGKCCIDKFAGVREIARTTKVSPSSVTNFFNKHFDDGGKEGHQKYKGACGDRTRLDNALKILAGDVRPSILWKTLSGNVEASDDG